MKLEEIIKISSKNPGKTVTILGGVHGNEVCGIQAIQKIISTLSLESGTAYFIFGNPRAIKENKRDTGTNLNRVFKEENLLSEKEKNSYERKRALEIIPYLQKSDAALDIHSSATPGSTPFIICEPHSFEIAQKLPSDLRSYGWDALEPGGTDYFMNQNGKIGICIECGYNLDPEAPKRAEEAIWSFFQSMGMITTSKPNKMRQQKTLHVYKVHITKTNFRPTRAFSDFENLKNGELIGKDGNEEIVATKNSVIIFCREREKTGEEAFILGKIE